MCMGILPPLCLCTYVCVGFTTSEEGTGLPGTRIRDWVLWKNSRAIFPALGRIFQRGIGVSQEYH